jgi:hypothetical protein
MAHDHSPGGEWGGAAVAYPCDRVTDLTDLCGVPRNGENPPVFSLLYHIFLSLGHLVIAFITACIAIGYA